MAAKKPAAKAAAKKVVAKKAAVKKGAAKAPAKKAATKKAPAKAPAKKVATKAPAKKAAVKKGAAKAPAKKAATKKAPAKAPAKTAAAKKAPTKAPVKKAATKSAPSKANAQKAPAKTAKPSKGKAATASAKTSKSTVKAPAKKTASRAKANSKKVARAVGTVQNFDDFKPYKPSRGDSYMDEKQLEHFRGLLLQWRGELVDEVTRTVSHMKDEASNFPDPADRATQEEEFSLELRTRDRERKLIKKIDGMLERITIDDYGYCDACGIEIGVKRLEARPTATLCIDCKTLSEIKERQELG